MIFLHQSLASRRVVVPLAFRRSDVRSKSSSLDVELTYFSLFLVSGEQNCGTAFSFRFPSNLQSSCCKNQIQEPKFSLTVPYTIPLSQ